MSRSDVQQGWGAVMISLHWLIALLILGMFGLGWWMVDLPISMQAFKTYALHKSIGLSVLALVLLRLIWRALTTRPRPAVTSRWQARAAQVSHVLLYLLMLALPLSGWLYNSSANFPLQFFGWFNLPALVEPDAVLREWALRAHIWIGWALLALLVLHVGAALKHHFMDRDHTLLAMLPWTGRRLRSGDTR